MDCLSCSLMGVANHGKGFVQKAEIFVLVDVFRSRKKIRHVRMFSCVLACTEQ